MPDADLGNAGSWWRPYVGKYELTLADGVTMDDTTVMLSTILDVMFTGDMVVPDGVTQVAALPDDCCPSKTIYLYVAGENEGVISQTPLEIGQDGNVTMLEAGAKTLHLNGCSFNICGRYYGKEVE